MRSQRGGVDLKSGCFRERRCSSDIMALRYVHPLSAPLVLALTDTARAALPLEAGSRSEAPRAAEAQSSRPTMPAVAPLSEWGLVAAAVA